MRYKLTASNDSQGINVSIDGEMTIYAVNDLHKEIMDLVKNEGNMTINLSQVKSFDTSGAQLLIHLKKLFSGNKILKLKGHSQAVLKAFDLYGLTGFFGDPIAIKKSEKDSYAFQYGLKSHPEKP